MTRPSGLNFTIMSEPLSTGPDVVVLIDPHRVRERPRVEIVADLADVRAVRAELEQLRGGRAKSGASGAAA